MNKILAVLGMLLVGVSAFAASPTFNSFDTTRFTANAAANSVDLKIAGIDTNYFSAATMAYLASLAGGGGGGGSSNAFNISQFSSNANFISIKSAAPFTNTILSAESGADVRTIYANQAAGFIVQGDGSILWMDNLGNVNITYTNGATQVYMGKSLLINGGITGTEAGVPWNIGYLAASGVLTNSSTGDLGTLSYAQLATVLGVFGTTNSIFGGTFGTNSQTGQTFIDAQGNISHTSTNSTYIVFNREGTNGSPPLLTINGTNGSVTITNGLYIPVQYNFTNTFVFGNGGGALTTNAPFGADPLSFIQDGSSAGKYDTFVGSGAGLGNTAGSHNTFVGALAGPANTTGDQNTFVGMYAGLNNTSGFHNTAIGAYAGQNLTAGSYNTYIGCDAGPQGNTGQSNTYNTVVGNSAVFNLTSGSFNTVMGGTAGLGLTTGGYNSIFGQEAGVSLTTADGNNLFGYKSGNKIKTGTYNNALGFQSLMSDVTGSHNVAIGYGALQDDTNAGWSVVIGYKAGTNATNLVRSVLLGGTSGTALKPVTNSVAIGWGALVTNNNTIVLGTSAETVSIPGTFSSSGASSFGSASISNATFVNGIQINSNTPASLPTLLKGDSFYWSSNGVAFVIQCGPTGTLTTNPVVYVPPGGGSGNLDPLNTANSILVEEFPSSAIATATIGTLGWYTAKQGGGSFSVGTVAAGHPGVMVLNTGATSTDGAVLGLMFATNSTAYQVYPALNATTGWTNTWIFKLSITNDCVMWMGLANQLIFLSTEPADWMGLIVDSNGTSPLFRYTCRSSSSSNFANGPALDATWHQFRMWSTVSGTIGFDLDGANAQTISSTVPTTTLTPMVVVKKSASTTGVTLNLDYWSGVMTGLTRF